jgi:hypothetical protein
VLSQLRMAVLRWGGAGRPTAAWPSRQPVSAALEARVGPRRHRGAGLPLSFATRECPLCREEIKPEAIKRKHCGSMVGGSASSGCCEGCADRGQTLEGVRVQRPHEVPDRQPGAGVARGIDGAGTGLEVQRLPRQQESDLLLRLAGSQEVRLGCCPRRVIELPF